MIVASKLTLDWSPEQISGWLKIQYPNNESTACAPRDHLPQFVHPGSRSVEKGADSTPPVQAAYTLPTDRTEPPSGPLEPTGRSFSRQSNCALAATIDGGEAHCNCAYAHG